VDNGVGTELAQQAFETLVLFGQVEVDEANVLAGQFLPHAQAFAHRPDRCERLDFQLHVDLASAEIVNNGDVVARVREVQCGGPATKSVAAKYQYLHIAPSKNRIVAVS
jgi:hypothetical protein